MTIGLRHYKQELNKIWVLPRLATYDVNYKSLNCIEAMPRISSSCCLSRSRQSYFACNPRYTLCYTSRFLDGILFARGPCAWLSLRFCGNWKRIQLLILFSTSLATLPWRIRSTPRYATRALRAPCTHRATQNVKFNRGYRSTCKGRWTFAFMSAQHCHLNRNILNLQGKVPGKLPPSLMSTFQTCFLVERR